MQTYMYVDSVDNVIDKILVDYGIPVKFGKEYRKELPDGSQSQIKMGFLTVRKAYEYIMENKVFPELHEKMKKFYGKDYEKFSEEINRITDELESKENHE